MYKNGNKRLEAMALPAVPRNTSCLILENYANYQLHFHENKAIMRMKLCSCLVRQTRRYILFQLANQPQKFQLSRVLRPGGPQVDPGGVDGAVAQHIRQLYDIPGRLIKDAGEQVAQVVGEYFAGLHPRGRTQ